jgi:hypothetical protein
VIQHSLGRIVQAEDHLETGHGDARSLRAC